MFSAKHWRTNFKPVHRRLDAFSCSCVAFMLKVGLLGLAMWDGVR